MNRSVRLALRLLAVGVIVWGALVLLPPLLTSVASLLATLRHNWWLVLLVVFAVWLLWFRPGKR